tara:strand:+ start:57068 stop:57856 length:789 start_codon:yes stop_codon:yes gene_type:complete
VEAVERISDALNGRTIVVTRPQEQAESLCRAIEQRGGTALRFPVIGIGPLADRSEIERVAGRLDTFDLAFFVSPNAVRYALDGLLVARDWPASLRVATVGKGSERALAARGFDKVIAPESGFDSESVLALPAFAPAAVRGHRILVLRGDGGRDLLGETLVARGAEVEYLSCYRRFCPDVEPDRLLEPVKRREVDGVLLSSSEGARNLADIVGAAGMVLLSDVPVFASHPRIAAQCRELGFARVIEAGAGDEGALRTIISYFG